MRNETRLLSRNASGTASLREVLTGEPRSYDVHVTRQGLEVLDIRIERDVRELLGENSLGRLPDLTKQGSLQPCSFQAELKPANAGEEACDTERLLTHDLLIAHGGDPVTRD
ncbi:hypothetical protein SNS2_3932 [Streptomyces netropsis]|nr:hypothetical protein SNS2_3932 [Streptomyces netropsis]